jgi:hypothetical protein
MPARDDSYAAAIPPVVFSAEAVFSISEGDVLVGIRPGA